MVATKLVDDWLEADGLILLESWARDGYTVEDIATRIGITQQCLRGWMSKYPDIKKAINNGRELVDYKVENALLKSALGYKTKEVRVTAIIKNGRIVEEKKETVDKEMAPNVSACQVWLYNRKPNTWKNMNSKSNILDNLSEEDTNVHIVIERASMPKTNQPTSATIDEVDTDWQNDVNESVTIRGMTKEEKADAKKKQQEEGMQKEKKSQSPDVHKQKKQSKKTSDSTVDDVQEQNNIDTNNDIDYWPDDWEEDEEWED